MKCSAPADSLEMAAVIHLHFEVRSTVLCHWHVPNTAWREMALGFAWVLLLQGVDNMFQYLFSTSQVSTCMQDCDPFWVQSYIWCQ